MWIRRGEVVTLLVASMALGPTAFASPSAQASPPAVARAAPAAQTIAATTKLSRTQIMTLPDSAVLVGPKGERITAVEAKRQQVAVLSVTRSISRPSKASHARAGQRARDVVAAMTNENNLAQSMLVPARPAAPLTGAVAGTGANIEMGARRGAAVAPSVLRRSILCGATPTPSILSVNGRRKDATFTPGGHYVITGCALGDTPGRITVSGVSTTGQPQTVELTATSWTANSVVAQIDPALSGIGDITAANVVVEGKGGTATVGGHHFFAARDVVQIPISRDLIDFNVNGSWSPRYEGGTASRSYLAVKEGARGNGSTGGVGENDTPEAPGNKFCTPWVTAVDHWHTDKLVSVLGTQGFEWESAATNDLTPTVQVDDDNSQAISLGTFSAEWRGDEFIVTPHGHSCYVKEQFWVSDSGYSRCQSRYSVAIFASGPRGVTPHLR